MLGIIVPILFTYYVYRNAKENGRNAVLWTFINICVIFGIQIAVGAAVVITLALIYGWSDFDDPFNGWSPLINFLGLGLSLLGSYFVYRHVTRVPESLFNEPPPPPPKFD